MQPLQKRVARSHLLAYKHRTEPEKKRIDDHKLREVHHRPCILLVATQLGADQCAIAYTRH